MVVSSRGEGEAHRPAVVAMLYVNLAGGHMSFNLQLFFTLYLFLYTFIMAYGYLEKSVRK